MPPAEPVDGRKKTILRQLIASIGHKHIGQRERDIHKAVGICPCTVDQSGIKIETSISIGNRLIEANKFGREIVDKIVTGVEGGKNGSTPDKRFVKIIIAFWQKREYEFHLLVFATRPFQERLHVERTSFNLEGSVKGGAHIGLEFIALFVAAEYLAVGTVENDTWNATDAI